MHLENFAKGYQTNVMLYAGPDPLAKQFIPVLTIACVRCGKIDQFAEKALNDAADNREVVIDGGVI